MYLSPKSFRRGIYLLCLLLPAAWGISRDYYWIGGSGDWSDISHWATTSGGSVTHNQAPTAGDDVFFDSKSFPGAGQVVTVNSDNAFCHNFSWLGASGNPIFRSASNTVLNVYGSIDLINAMSFEFLGDVHLLAASGNHHLNAAGQLLHRNLLLQGTATWALQDDIQVDSLIELKSGSLVTAGHNISAGYLYILPATPVNLQLGASRIQLHGKPFRPVPWEDYPVCWIQSENLTLAAGTSTFEFTSPFGELRFRTAAAPVVLADVYFSNGGGEGLIAGDNGSSFRCSTLQFDGHGKILPPANINHLMLAPGKQYELNSGQTYQLQQITAVGTCAQPIGLRSTIAGDAVNFQATSGNIQLEFTTIRDLNASGGALFVANNAVDLGNNTGWTINARNGNDLYWVGGSGNWDDPMHWSFTSGGAGGACVPSGVDNVFFDGNSFSAAGQTVTVTSSGAHCRDMRWTGAAGNPVFAGSPNHQVNIYGSLLLIPSMQWHFEGDVFFVASAPGQTITTAGQTFKRNLIFNGNNGEWALQDKLEVILAIQLFRGSFITNDQDIICEDFLSNVPSPRTIRLGSSHVLLRLTRIDFCEWTLHASNLNFDAGTSLVELSTASGGMYHYGPRSILQYYHVLFSSDNAFVYSDQSVSTRVQNLRFLSQGYLGATVTSDTLDLAKGAEYTFIERDTQYIGRLIARGACDGTTLLFSGNPSEPAYFVTTKDNTNQYLSIQNIHALGPGRLIADQSIDLGNNNGWMINTLAPRTLYWVGGSGDWEDTAHWSLSSGGPGGACIPTDQDDVIFDERSFSQTGEVVSAIQYWSYRCRSMDWSRVTNSPQIRADYLLVFGSLTLSPDMTYSVSVTRFRGKDQHTITSAGHNLSYIYFEGPGKWTLQDDFEVNYINFYEGTWCTAGFDVTLANIYFSSGDNPKKIVLDSTHMVITGPTITIEPWRSYGSNLTVDAGTSLIEFTNPTGGMKNRDPLVFHQVLFSANEGQSCLGNEVGGSRYQWVKFNNDGIITGNNTFDTLLFAPGKSYKLAAGLTQTVNDYLQIIGNNCTPIELSSTQQGMPATISSTAAVINGDFIQMRDQKATGGARFFAGGHSTDIGNSNTGWIFDNAPGYVEDGFFGPDRVLCFQQSIALSAANNSTRESYLWQDGSTDAVFSVTAPGTYWAEVTFANNCQVRDTIRIAAQETFHVNLPADTVLCDGAILNLDATLDLTGITYEWENGSDQAQRTITGAGRYSVLLSLSGCTSKDSLEVSYVSPASLELGPDTVLCENAILLLDPGISGAGYQWQDGSSASSYTVTGPGRYHVIVTTSGCAVQDSIAVAYNPLPRFNLGNDSTLCAGRPLVLQAEVPNGRYRWQDGSSGVTFAATVSGNYWLEVDLAGCTARDSIEINFKPAPVFEFGPDTTLCKGQSLTLVPIVPQGTTLRWQDGSTDSQYRIRQQGQFHLNAAYNGCTYGDTIHVYFADPPVADLGADRVICAGEDVVLDATVNGAMYRWSDSSTDSFLTTGMAGLYWVEVSFGICSDRDSVEVTVTPLPELQLSNDTTVCEGGSAALQAFTAPGVGIQWPDGSTGAIFEAKVPGTYTAIATENGCESRDSVQLNWQAPLIFSLGQDTVVCDDTPYSLRGDRFGGQGLVWSDGSTLPVLSITAPGTYWLDVYNGACVSRDSIQVEFRTCAYFSAYIPNAFSPESAREENRLFKPYFPPGVEIVAFKMNIFDRWGNHLFSTQDPEGGWDGAWRDQPMDTGVYLYFIDVTYLDDRGEGREQLSGDIAVFR